MTLKIALLGSESTGKTELALRLTEYFRTGGKRVCIVPDVLREWCLRHARTPRPEEQPAIAREQARRANEPRSADLVIADTTPLMIAIYRALLLETSSLYDMALDHQRSFDLTLVTGLDLPWLPNGLPRNGPHVRESVDALLRAALARGKIPYQVVYGAGALRTDNALKCIAACQKLAQPLSDSLPSKVTVTEPTRAVWGCERCSDPVCEHRLFTSLLPRA